jgi:hypothetical protein
VTFAGSSISDDDTFTPKITEHYSVNKKTFSVNVPAGSAAVIILQ